MPSDYPSSEVLVQFETLVTGPDGRNYTPRACGRPADDGRWEGWIEFVAPDQREVLSSPRETVQPNRTDVAYWASGLTQVYLEGAFQRAWDAEVAIPRVVEMGGPAPKGPSERTPTVIVDDVVPASRAVLDPFQVYAQGEEVLRQQLRALDVAHLEQIVRAYDLAPHTTTENDSRAALEATILAGVRLRAGA